MEIRLVDLPDELLRGILQYVSYEEVSNLRLVCRRFNATGQSILNNAFVKAKKEHARILLNAKSLLPRRESERKIHELFPFYEVLNSMDSLLILLTNTYERFITMGLICFIPGRILDEVFALLHTLNESLSRRRSRLPAEFLQQLRDLTYMAVDHFQEHIAPVLNNRRDLIYVSDGMRFSNDTDTTNDANQQENEETTATHNEQLCPISEKLMKKVEKLEKRYKRDKRKINLLHTRQTQEILRLDETIARVRLQQRELRKLRTQVADLNARNTELSYQLKSMNGPILVHLVSVEDDEDDVGDDDDGQQQSKIPKIM